MKRRWITYPTTGKFLILAMLMSLLATWPEFSALPALAQQNGQLIFVENLGQFEDSVRFQAYGGQTTLTLTDDALWFTVLEPVDVSNQTRQATEALTAATPPRPSTGPQRGVNLKLDFVGANRQPRLEPFNRLDTHLSYFIGRNPADWRTDIPVWGGVRYVDLYPGLDLEITSENGQLAPRLVVRDTEVAAAATTDIGVLKDVRLRVEGANKLALDQAGRLGLTTSIGNFTLPLFQLVSADNTRLAAFNAQPLLDETVVTAPFASASGTMTVATAAGSELLYSTLLGGAGNLDSAADLVVDGTGHAYVTGLAYPGFPTTPGAFDTSIEGVYTDAFVVKLNPDGTGLVYATFLGGNDYDTGAAIRIDEAGNAYVTGFTTSLDFSTTPGAFDDSLGDGSDAFVAKLNPTGTDLIYGTYLGGSELDFGSGLAIDEAGYAYVAGDTQSPDFPVTSAAVDTVLLGSEAFVAKLTPDGSGLVYATFLGGSHADYGRDLAIDQAGHAYLVGDTRSDDFPTTPGAFDTSYADTDVFVAKIAPDGADLVYATYLGGRHDDMAQAITVDEAEQAYVTGFAGSDDFFTTPAAFDPVCDDCDGGYLHGDAFVVKLTADGADVVYASFLGGGDTDFGYDIALDNSGNTYVTGHTVSPDFPVTPTAFDTTCNGCDRTYPYSDVFVARIDPAGTELGYATFLGGDDGYDDAFGLAVDQAGAMYLTGRTTSSDFPLTTDAFDTSLEGFADVFVTKLVEGAAEPPPEVPPHSCAPTLLGTITVGSTPRGLAVDLEHNRVYVANYGSNSVSVIDSSTNTVIQTILDIPTPNYLAYDPTHNIIWVTSYSTDQLFPIQANADATDFTVQAPLAVGAGPWGVAYVATNDYVYVANNQDDTVTVVGTQTATPTGVATLTGEFSRPVNVAANPITGRVYVTNFASHNVTAIEGMAITKMVDLYDSTQPYGLAVDETRGLVYVATVDTNRVVVIGPDPQKGPDQFYGWAAFYRGFGNRNRPVPLRNIAINPETGPTGDGGHLWTTTAVADGSEANQLLLIPKGWDGYFHYPLVSQLGANFGPEAGIAVDRSHNRVYVSNGSTPGAVTVLGDHADLCPGVEAADQQTQADNRIDFDLFSVAALAQGDVTGDGRVDILDLAFIASNYGVDNPAADVNGDNRVDIFDLVTAANNFGRQVRY